MGMDGMEGTMRRMGWKGQWGGWDGGNRENNREDGRKRIMGRMEWLLWKTGVPRKHHRRLTEAGSLQAPPITESLSWKPWPKPPPSPHFLPSSPRRIPGVAEGAARS